jgi:hypothetical protein
LRPLKVSLSRQDIKPPRLVPGRFCFVPYHSGVVGQFDCGSPDRLELDRYRAHILVMVIPRKFWWNAVRYAVGAVMLVLFAYGAIRFGDGPISEYQGGYRSTRRVPHTAEEYRAYKIWEKTIFIVWPLGIAIGFLLQRTKPDGEDS